MCRGLPATTAIHDTLQAVLAPGARAPGFDRIISPAWVPAPSRMGSPRGWFAARNNTNACSYGAIGLAGCRTFGALPAPTPHTLWLVLVAAACGSSSKYRPAGDNPLLARVRYRSPNAHQRCCSCSLKKSRRLAGGAVQVSRGISGAVSVLKPALP